MLVRAFVVIFALSLSACAIVPEPLQVPENTPLVGYNKAVVAGDDILGKSARWGGIITNVENKPDQTLIEVVYFPLNHYGKPNASDETPGRFKAVINKFVDPIMFEEGRTVTFLGKVGKPLAGMVGEQPYMFPSLAVDNYYIWRRQRVYDTSTVFFDFYSGWYSPFYHPYWSPWRFGPSVRMIRTYKDPAYWSGSKNNYRPPSNSRPSMSARPQPRQQPPSSRSKAQRRLDP